MGKPTGRRPQQRAKRAIIGFLIVLLASFSAEVATRVGWLTGLELLYYDLWHLLAGPRSEPRHVVIVSVDTQAFLEHRDEPLVFWGPYFARAVEKARRAGASIIGLDYLFSVSAESWLSKTALARSDQGRTHDIPLRAQLASGRVVLIGDVATDDQGNVHLALPIEDYLFALPGGLADVGLGNFLTDADGAVRRFTPALFEDGRLPSLTFATLLAVRAAGMSPASASWSLAGREVANGALPLAIGFIGPPGAVPRLPFSRLLSPGSEGNAEIEGLKDKVVIVAAEHLGNQDIHLTPYARGFMAFGGRLMGGAEVHANIVETLLTGRFPRPLPSSVRLLSFAVLLSAATALFLRVSPWRGLGAGVTLFLLCALLGFFLFLRDWVLPVAAMQSGVAACYMLTLGIRLTGEERERLRLREMFGKYVSDEVVEKLLALGRRPDQRGESYRVTVLFSDIRNFTTISEKLTPHEVVDLLNAYFTRVCEPILEQGGTVDKFIGDAVMAFFGAPAPYDDHAERALRASVALADIAREFRVWVRERFPLRDLPEFRIGVGLHTGEVVVGSIGSPKRLHFTAIGDTVNAASRLEGLTKDLGWTIVASAEVIKAAAGVATAGDRKTVTVKGREAPIEVVEVTGLKTEQRSLRKESPRRTAQASDARRANLEE
ncbi:MAG TPA: adenylate/guanylate cyclase domain-containing protein [Syntrophobacteria bacterium]|nr:adenylate/guanylate cyclase domain-containing protein [Syntrophobacteria bacterium]